MAQTRYLDYRSARSTQFLKDKTKHHFLNSKFIGNVTDGLELQSNGDVNSGSFISPDGTVIVESATTSVGVPASPAIAAGEKRYDLFYVTYEYLATLPVPVATFRVEAGTPAVSPLPPEVPSLYQDKSILIGLGRISFGSPTYSVVYQSEIEVITNLTKIGHQIYEVIDGALISTREYYGRHYLYSLGIEYSPAGTFSTGQKISASSLTNIFTIDQTGKIEQLEDLAGFGRTTETVKGNADDIIVVKGLGWTVETVKDNYDTLLAHITSAYPTGGHLADKISISDAGSIITETTVEGAFQEIVGPLRTSQTIKGNNDLVLARVKKSGGEITGACRVRDDIDINFGNADNYKIRYDSGSDSLYMSGRILTSIGASGSVIFNDGAWKTVPFIGTEYDYPGVAGRWKPLSNHFTADRGVYLQIFAQIGMQAPTLAHTWANTDLLEAMVQKYDGTIWNDYKYLGSQTIFAATTNDLYLKGTAMVRLSAGEKFRVQARQKNTIANGTYLQTLNRATRIEIIEANGHGLG